MTRPERNRETCLLCGVEGEPTTYGVVRYLEFAPGHEYGTVDRCVDRVACRARVVAQGRRWEINDGPAGPLELAR